MDLDKIYGFVKYLDKMYYTSIEAYKNNPGLSPIHIHVITGTDGNPQSLHFTIDCSNPIESVNCIFTYLLGEIYANRKLHFIYKDDGSLMSYKASTQGYGYGPETRFAPVISHFHRGKFWKVLENLAKREFINVKKIAFNNYQKLLDMKLNAYLISQNPKILEDYLRENKKTSLLILHKTFMLKNGDYFKLINTKDLSTLVPSLKNYQSIKNLGENFKKALDEKKREQSQQKPMETEKLNPERLKKKRKMTDVKVESYSDENENYFPELKKGRTGIDKFI